jgi:hypothetical protein
VKVYRERGPYTGRTLPAGRDEFALGADLVGAIEDLADDLAGEIVLLREQVAAKPPEWEGTDHAADVAEWLDTLDEVRRALAGIESGR